MTPRQEIFNNILVPGEGFEPPTFGLQNRCTTTVLTRHLQLQISHLTRELRLRPRPEQAHAPRHQVNTFGRGILQARTGNGYSRLRCSTTLELAFSRLPVS